MFPTDLHPPTRRHTCLDSRSPIAAQCLAHTQVRPALHIPVINIERGLERGRRLPVPSGVTLHHAEVVPGLLAPRVHLERLLTGSNCFGNAALRPQLLRRLEQSTVVLNIPVVQQKTHQDVPVHMCTCVCVCARARFACVRVCTRMHACVHAFLRCRHLKSTSSPWSLDAPHV
jgi:hypothetical protein